MRSAFFALVLCVGCGDYDASPVDLADLDGTGGEQAVDESGGSTGDGDGSGGADVTPASGGSTSSGGAVASGGSQASGGETASGGEAASGGAQSSGGADSSGGMNTGGLSHSDTDGDQVPDNLDQCEGGDDSQDLNENGEIDECEPGWCYEDRDPLKTSCLPHPVNQGYCLMEFDVYEGLEYEPGDCMQCPGNTYNCDSESENGCEVYAEGSHPCLPQGL